MTSSIANKVFIPHDVLVWVEGETVLSSYTNNDKTTNTVSHLEIEVKYHDDELPINENNTTKVISLNKFGLESLPLQNVNIPSEGVEDMTHLNYLHEPAILDNLKR